MANITEILGTDSVSSSRPIINTNLELLNDELASITALLNPTTLALSGIALIETSAITVAQGGTNIMLVNNLGTSFGKPAIFADTTKIGASLQKSGVTGTKATPAANLAPTSIVTSSYFIGSTFTLPAADPGQELTLINTASVSVPVIAAADASIAATSIALIGLNSTITLRCFESVWYVISSHNANIV
mgnify:CR=1 FL=1